MDAIYPFVTRQTGLVREMDTIAQNIANASTTGYRAEGLVFAEHVTRGGGGAPSLSMGHATGRVTSPVQGGLERTGGAHDLAIEGEGWFAVGGPDGEVLLTRAGAFATDPFGTLVTPDGLPVLDPGGAPIAIPPGGGALHVAPDGTLSVNGEPFGQIGLVVPDDPVGTTRSSGTRFAHDGELLPVENPRVMQGFLESSNTSTVLELARMIEVQNAYGAGQSIMDREDERMRAMMRLMDSR